MFIIDCACCIVSHFVLDFNTLIAFGAESKLWSWSCTFICAPICYRFISTRFFQLPFSHIPLACVRVHIFTGLKVYIVVRIMITVLLSDTSVWKSARTFLNTLAPHPSLFVLRWSAQYLPNSRLGGPHSRSGFLEEGKNFFVLSGNGTVMCYLPSPEHTHNAVPVGTVIWSSK